jgi:hypothetical protein
MRYEKIHPSKIFGKRPDSATRKNNNNKEMKWRIADLTTVTPLHKTTVRPENDLNHETDPME